MTNILEIIESDINWRIGEIALIKMNSASISINKERKECAQRYAIPALYSVWEGFVVATFTEFVRLINRLSLPVCEVNTDIIVHAAYSKCNLNNERKSFEKKKNLIGSLYSFFTNNQTELPLEIPTNSNVDYETLKNIHLRYNLPAPNEAAYKSQLTKYVSIRNKVAHGDNSIIITREIIIDFSETIISLMYEIQDIIKEGIKDETFKKQPLTAYFEI